MILFHDHYHDDTCSGKNNLYATQRRIVQKKQIHIFVDAEHINFDDLAKEILSLKCGNRV